METTNVKAEFVIIGDALNPKLLTNELGVTPTQFWRKGDKIEGKNINKQDSCWIIGTNYEESFDINDQLYGLIAILEKKQEILKELKTKFNFEYLFVIVINVENNELPAMHFDRKFLDFVHSIEAEFYIDLYIM